MYKIAHISDLHVQSDGTKKNPTAFQILIERLGIVAVVADSADRDKIRALENSLKLLQPDMLVVTGDLTNFGDRESLQEASDLVRTLLKASGAKKVVVIPGNHDTLCDRAEAVGKTGRLRRLLIALLAKASPEIHTALRLKPKPRPKNKMGWFGRLQLPWRRSQSAPHILPPQDLSAQGGKPQTPDTRDNPFVASFTEVFSNAFGVISPGRPVVDSAPWGTIAVFPFDSTSEDLLLCNEGAILAEQFNSANRRIDTPDDTELDIKDALKIAALHHHPLSAPVDEQMADRGFNSMRNGGIALRYFNRKQLLPRTLADGRARGVDDGHHAGRA